jgi:hypothetical protein
MRKEAPEHKRDMVDKSRKYSKIVTKMPLTGIIHERKKSIDEMESSLRFSEAGNHLLTQLIEKGISAIGTK